MLSAFLTQAMSNQLGRYKVTSRMENECGLASIALIVLKEL
jgi:hypothetical protein